MPSPEATDFQGVGTSCKSFGPSFMPGPWPRNLAGYFSGDTRRSRGPVESRRTRALPCVLVAGCFPRRTTPRKQAVSTNIRGKMMKAKASPKHCTREDAEIGARIRFLRMQAEKSQTWLATQLGVTFQQVQKYEKGVNRVGAARLQRIAVIF